MRNDTAQQVLVAASRILIVDDESNVRHLLSRWLTEDGYSCLEARDSEEAWERLQQNDIGLVTLDCKMGGESGVDIIHVIRQRFPDTAILILTAIDTATNAITALTRGAYGYLIKPVDREIFLFHVRQGLALRRRDVEKREAVPQPAARPDSRLLTDSPHSPGTTLVGWTASTTPTLAHDHVWDT